MPVHPVPGGFQFGNSGKVYPKKSQAQDQQAAAYANGYKPGAQDSSGDKSGALPPQFAHKNKNRHKKHQAQQQAVLNMFQKKKAGK